MKKKFLSFLTILCMITVLLPANITAFAAETSGTCGNNLTWNLDSSGTLTISGKGDMTDWSSGYNVPWKYLGSSIKSVKISDGVTSIGNCAFATGNYNKLVNVTIGNDVTSIGDNAFYACESLASITIPSSVTSIGKVAFKQAGLTSIIIPDSVTSIKFDTFNECTKLTSVTIGNGVTSIDSYAFRQTSLTSITIPDSVTKIGSLVFSGCTKLKSVTIGNTVTSIGNSVFLNCTGLENVKMGNSVKTMGYNVFYGCTSLTSISIPDSVISIGVSPFGGCTSLREISVGKNNEYYSSDSYGVLYNKTKTNLIEYPMGSLQTEFELPNSVTSIDSGAFYNCSSLVTVYYNGTEAEWNNISIGSNNEDLTKATRIYFAYINIFDKDGKEIVNTTQNMGEYVDTSSITVPDGYILKLYKDEKMTEEYSLDTPISENLSLYADLIKFTGTKTTVSENGKTFTIKPINIASGNTVILALYSGEEFVTMQSAVYSGKDIPFTVTDDYTTAKVMVWNNLDDIMPICDVEIVK